MSSEMDDVRREVAIANRILAETGLATGIRASLGHASFRIPSQPDRFVVKGRGYAIDALAAIRPEQMVVCDLEGFKLDGPPGSTQPREVTLHSCIYKARPDVQSVVHVHPKFTILMGVLGTRMVPMSQEGSRPGVQLLRNSLPVYPHCKTVVTQEEGMDVAGLLGNSKAILMRGHGATSVGRSLEDSVSTMLRLEEEAELNWMACCAAGPDHPRIPDEDLDEWANRPSEWELPHLKAAAQEAGLPGTGGVWDYYASVVSRDL